MNPITKSSLLSLLCLTTSLVAQGAEQTLRTTAKKGASIWLIQEDKQEQTIDQGGQQMEMGNTTTHTVHLTVTDVDDKGVLTVEAEIVRVHGSVQSPMGDTEFDSATPAGDDEDGGFGMSSKAMTRLAGKKFTAKVEPRGTIASLEGTAELISKGGRMGGGVSEGSLKQMVTNAFGMMPEKPVAQGSTWDHVEKATGRMPMNNKLTLTVAKLDDATFEITTVGTVEKPAGEAPAAAGEGEGDEEAQMRKMLENTKISNGKIAGSQKVSRQDGFVVEATNTMTMDVDMETPMGDVSMNVKKTTTTKRTTAEAAMPKKVEPAKEAAKTGDK